MRRLFLAFVFLASTLLPGEEPIRVGSNSDLQRIGINPLILDTEDQIEIAELVNDRLITLDAQNRFVGQILESWTTSSDDREVILKVRPGLRWQDGKPIEADDILHTWRLLRTPKLREMADNQAAAIPSMEKVDKLTLRIRLDRPRATLLAELYNFIPVPRTYPPVTDPKVHPFRLKPIGSGPFRVSPDSSPGRLVLDRWPDYRGPHPASWSRLEFHYIKEGLGPAMVESSQVHFLEYGSWLAHYLARTGVKGYKNVITHQGIREGFTALWFNCDPKTSVLSDVRLRRALAELYPWDAIAKMRAVRPVQVAGCVWPPSSFAYDGTPHPLPRRQLAESYLDEAGWRRGSDGWRRNAAGRELRLEFVQQVQDYVDPIMASFLAGARDCGIRIEVQYLPFEGTLEAQQKGRGDIWVVNWSNNGPDPSGDSRLFTRDGIPTPNFAHYSNPKVDQLFEDGSHAMDPDERALIYRRINQTLIADRPLLTIDYSLYFGYQNRRLKGLAYSKQGKTYGFFPGPRGWTLD